MIDEAMGFPSSGLEGVYRNDIRDVAALLDSRHDGSYMVWNLSDRVYDASFFHNQVRPLSTTTPASLISHVCYQVLSFPFPDHPSPPFATLLKIIASMDSWLRATPSHIAVVHCLVLYRDLSIYLSLSIHLS